MYTLHVMYKSSKLLADNYYLLLLFILIYIHTGVELSKILGGQIKILGGKMIKSDKCMGVSELLGARAGLPPSLRLCQNEHGKLTSTNDPTDMSISLVS